MGGICSSKSEFKGVKNSVVLTKQKTDKKQKEDHLKIVNENYKDLMNKQLSNLGPGMAVVQDSCQVLNPDAKPNDLTNYPEFKRHEYDEGHLKKELIYFNQINPNFIKTLGRNFYNLLPLYKSIASPALISLVKVFLGDLNLSLEDFQRQKSETALYISKQDKQNPTKLVLEILRVGLEREGITLLHSTPKQFSPNLSKKTFDQLQHQETQDLTLSNLHLLSTNMVSEYLILEFKETESHSFGSLSAETHLREAFIQELSDTLLTHLSQKGLYSLDAIILPMSILHHDEQGSEGKSFKLCVFLPEIQQESLAKAVFAVDACLKFKYPGFYLSLERTHLLKTLRVGEEDWNAWGNREYRETIPMSNTYLVSPLGGRPYFKPGNGWKRYALDVSKFGEDLLWLQTPGHEEKKGDWANGYVNIFNCYMKNPASLFFSGTESLFNFLANEVDAGNFDKCGRGVIFTNKIENFLIRKNPADTVIRTTPVEVVVDEEKRWFLVILQCRVKPDSIRSPKKYENSLFLVNDPSNIRPNGILIKEIIKSEAEAYFNQK